MNRTLLKSLVVAGFVLSGLGFATVEAEAATITVRQGNTLARLFPSNWNFICAHNGLANCNLIFPGQVLDDGAGSTRVSGVSASSPNFSAGVPGLSNILGASYVYGATGPYAYDCSGLTQYLASQMGFSLPRTSQQQGSFTFYSGTTARTISRGELQPGDLVLMNGGGHVGMYIGNNQLVHAINPSAGIGVESLDMALAYNPGYWFRALGH